MKRVRYIVSGSLILGSLLMASTALAAEQGQQGPWGGEGHGPTKGLMMRTGHATSTWSGIARPGIAGVVASISGNTLTVNSRMPMMGAGDGNHTVSTTTYTVDATNATVYKNNATSTLSSVATGDMVFVAGTVSGTTVTATTIRDGVFGGRPGMGSGMDDKKFHMGSSTPRGGTDLPFGNGMPVIGGNVASVSGNTVTITNKGGVTYTVDVTSAKISKHGVTSATVSDVVVGDSVVVQGTFNGTAVTASIVVDQGARPALPDQESGTQNGTNENQGQPRNFGAAVGLFFSHLFGF